MTKKGHLLFSSNAVGAAYLVSGLGLTLVDPNIYSSILSVFLGVYFGTLLPDVDEPNSSMGRKMIAISNVINLIFGHRGLTHSIVFAFLVGVLSFFFQPLSFWHIFFISAGVGCILHDMADMVTNEGVKGFFFPFFPNKRAVLLPRFLRFNTGSAVELFVILAMSISLIFMTLHLFNKI